MQARLSPAPSQTRSVRRLQSQSRLLRSRTRRTMASKLPVSPALVLCGLSQPLLCHCCKVIISAYHKKPFGCQYGGDEVFLPQRPLTIFAWRQHMRVDFPTQRVADTRHEGCHLSKANAPDNHQVDIAFRLSRNETVRALRPRRPRQVSNGGHGRRGCRAC